ncbi:fatty-acyl coenzyme A oxidase [Mycoemilia scoparia]|uniref:Acyl-coenzyme A oxidase n=1 Tax=Mycoemilia scoparia TaxID=417184 RepID=A0A9W8DT29_9FUNG|nr:fatty-acyl coenzyme A oxidase [Mycoemilia scoparia]
MIVFASFRGRLIARGNEPPIGQRFSCLSFNSVVSAQTILACDSSRHCDNMVSTSAPTPNSSNQAPINPMESLGAERKSPSFPVREMTYFVDGDKEATLLKEEIMLELERDPNWKIDDYPNLSLAEIRERTMAKVRRMADDLLTKSKEQVFQKMAMISVVDPGFWTRFGVHIGLFFGALQGQATPSQLSYWLERGAMTMQGIIGCFGMTELGHGSNVAGLETTATFDKNTDEFVIHTPTITATKWWIGGAAHTATHCAVYAQLIIDGKRYGVKTFVVQLRDPETFQLMPGVNIGDIGKKMGRDQIDNGWIQFTNVRIPRSHMLMKHTKVTREGKVIDPPMAQLAYGALILGRVSMVNDSGNVSKRALTIAIRYAAIRRQFASGPGQVETKLLDYPIHQHRLIPLLAQTFAMIFGAREMNTNYQNLMAQINSEKQENMQALLENLKETHATSAGLKAFCTWMCLNIIDQCRQSLGGHGYSAYTGLSTSYQDFVVHCTWEGDNTILTLQCGRYLVSMANQAKKGKPLPKNMSYLGEFVKSRTHPSCKGVSVEDVCSFKTLREAWGCVAANAIIQAANEFEEALKKGLDKDAAYEQCSASRLHAARMHVFTHLFNRFSEAAEASPDSLRPTLTKLAVLFATHSATQHSGEFLQCGYYNNEQIYTIKRHVSELCADLRNDAVSIVDSFNYSDYVINSPLGCFDGNIYVKYFDLVKRNNPQNEIPYFEKLIKPLLNRSVDSDGGPELEIDQEE